MKKLMINKFLYFVICLTMAFITEIAAHAQRPIKKKAAPKTQFAKVEVVAGGYRPEEFKLKRGIPARVTFIRKTEDECGEEVVFPDYNLRRKLPLNQAVTIAFTPRKSGNFSFACGMDMMRGKLIVQ